MERRPRVYIVNNKDYNLDPAKVYGDIVVLYEDTAHDIFSTSKHIHLLKQKLAEAQSSDYLALTGNLILNVLTSMILMERFGYVNLLLYNIKGERYEPRVVAKHQIRMEEPWMNQRSTPSLDSSLS